MDKLIEFIKISLTDISEDELEQVQVLLNKISLITYGELSGVIAIAMITILKTLSNELESYVDAKVNSELRRN